MSSDKSNGFQVPNLERGLQILEYMAGRDDEVSITRLARELGFPPNSVMRILNALTHHGYVLRNPETKGYTLSNKMVTICAGRASQKNLMEQSLDIMRELRDETGETVVISILDQHEGLVLEQLQGLHPFRFVCSPGTRQAAHASASTKCILAFMGEDERDAILHDLKYDRLTKNSISSEKAFRKELADVENKGYSLDRAEAIEGVHCAAAPIREASGKAIAAITVTGPSYRLKSDEMEPMGETVKRHAQKISQRLGFGL